MSAPNAEPTPAQESKAQPPNPTNPPSSPRQASEQESEVDWQAMARQWESRAKSNKVAQDDLATLRQSLAGLAGLPDAKGAKPEDAIAELTRRFDAMTGDLEVERLARSNGITDEKDIDLLRKTAPDAREALASRLKSSATVVNFDGGARSSAPAQSDMNRLLRQAAGRE